MSAPETSRSGWLETALRLQRIGVVLARHGFGEVVSRIGVAVPRLPGAALPPSSQERLARRFADVLTDLGPTYIKLGQLLATRADLFPPEVVRTLSTLHASVRPMPFRVVARTLDAELGQPHRCAFARVESTCVAAASIAQVHRATLHDGREVAVKVQRPDLRAQVEADLAIMRLVARLLDQHVPEVAAYAPVPLVESFARSITAELDFRIEAENARTLRRLLADAPEVHVPAIHERWTTERVLVMDYVAGQRLAELPLPVRARARHALLRAFVRQTLEHGVFHADPHPGNVLLSAEGRLVLLDHGMVAVLDESTRTRLFRLCAALLLRRHAALCEHVIALSEPSDARAIDRERLRHDVSGVLRATSAGAGAGMIGQWLTMSRVHGLRLPAALLAFMRALAILDGVLRGLDPAADVLRDLRRELAFASVRHARRVSKRSAHGLARFTTRHGARVLRVIGERTQLMSQWTRSALTRAGHAVTAAERQARRWSQRMHAGLLRIGVAFYATWQRHERSRHWVRRAPEHVLRTLRAAWQRRELAEPRPRAAFIPARWTRRGAQNGMSSSSCIAPPAAPPRLEPASSSRGGGGLSS